MRKNKNGIKKTKVVILLIVLIVFLLLFFILKNYFNRREVIRDRVINGINNLNYTYYDKSSSGKRTIYVLGKNEKVVDNNSTTYIDYANKISTTTNSELKYKESYSNNGIDDMSYYSKFINNYFDNDNYKYKYRGTKIKDGQKYIVVEFVLKGKSHENKSKIEFWISDSTNVIYKEVNYMYDGSKREKDYTYTDGKNTKDEMIAPEEVYTEYSEETNG